MCVSQTEMKRYLREKDFASQMCLIYIYIFINIGDRAVLAIYPLV